MDQITTYATLQTAVAGMMHRSDLTANLPLFIQLCEADLNNKLLLSDMQSDEPLTLVQNQNYIPLPSGFVSPIAFWLVISSLRTELEWCLPEQLPYNVSATQPTHVAVDGANLRFDCPAGSAYSAFLRCIKRSNLSVSNTSNALLLTSPDVYLYGTLKQAALYAADDAAVVKWDKFYRDAIAGKKASDSRSRGIAPLRSELGGHRSNILTGD
jgi:hypothetical protein